MEGKVWKNGESVAFFVVKMEYEYRAWIASGFYDGHFFVGATQCLQRIGVYECFYLWEMRSYTKIRESRESFAFAKKNGGG